jgi:hypothetical protein
MFSSPGITLFLVEKRSNIYGRKVYFAPVVTIMHFRAQLRKMGWGLDL